MISMKLGLTLKQREARKLGIGASEAAVIMSDNWLPLWLEKTGKAEPEDLSDKFAPMLGHVTETFNLYWYEKVTGRDLTQLGASLASDRHPFLRCTLDGFDEKLRGPVNAKHVNAYSKVEDLRSRYFPQMTHEMIVTGSDKAILSCIIGTNEPALIEIDFDPFYAETYIGRAKQFWENVTCNKPPQSVEAAEAAPIAPEKMRVVDMSGNNEWGSHAALWLEHKSAAKAFDGAVKDLKALVEPDVKEAFGHHVKIVRNKAGSLSIKEMA